MTANRFLFIQGRELELCLPFALLDKAEQGDLVPLLVG
jgi:hypothetical protein